MFTRQTKYNTSTNNTITKKQMNKQKKKILQCLTCRKLEARFLFPATSRVTFSGTLINTRSSSACNSTMYVLRLISWKLNRKQKLQEKR